MDPLLSLENVRVSYGKPGSGHLAVDRVSLSLHRGTTVCLVGESGSGKTSLALAIPRLLPGTARIEGRIVFRDLDLLKGRKEDIYEIRRRHISVIFQDAIGSLLPGTRVGTQLRRALAYRLGVSDREQLAKKTSALLEAVGLNDIERVLGSYPSELSGGMCQRVMIALALSAEPSLLIAEEPVSSLDAITQFRVLELLFGLQKNSGFGMLFVTHDLRVAARFDQIGVLRRGSLVELAPTHQLLSNPTAAYTRELLDAVRSLSMHSPQGEGRDGNMDPETV